MQWKIYTYLGLTKHCTNNTFSPKFVLFFFNTWYSYTSFYLPLIGQGPDNHYHPALDKMILFSFFFKKKKKREEGKTNNSSYPSPRKCCNCVASSTSDWNTGSLQATALSILSAHSYWPSSCVSQEGGTYCNITVCNRAALSLVTLCRSGWKREKKTGRSKRRLVRAYVLWFGIDKAP